MKRQISFKHTDGLFGLYENGGLVFSIDESTLKFDSLQFYTGIYKDNSSAIELVNETESGKIENYIFKWLSDLVDSIHADLNDPEPINDEMPIVLKDAKIIPLFDIAVCAGNGNFVDENVKHSDFETINTDADFALRISGKSMEPSIKDGAVVLVKRTNELKHGDIGIVTTDSETMCKRYIRKGKGVFLEPDNKDKSYKTYSKKDCISFLIQGKVIEVIG